MKCYLIRNKVSEQHFLLKKLTFIDSQNMEVEEEQIDNLVSEYQQVVKQLQSRPQIVKVLQILSISCKKSCKSKTKYKKIWIVSEYSELSLEKLIAERIERKESFHPYEIFQLIIQAAQLLADLDL